MKKRINSLIMALVMTLVCVLPLFTACSPKDGGSGVYTAAEWLSKVEDGFNLNYYTNDEPVLQNVLRDDPKFSIVQTAVEWGLIEVSDNVDFDAPITKEFCADTLVCAINFTDPAEVEIKDADKINPSYLDNVKIALENGIFAPESGKFDPAKKLSKDEADAAFDTAHDRWINFAFTESYDNSVVKENVVNLGGLSEEVAPEVSSDYSVEYSGSRQFFSGDQYADNTTKTITFKPDKIPAGLTEGSVLSMPADDVVPMNYAVVVDSITENEDGSVTVNTHNAELEDVFEEYNVQMHEEVDFSKARIFGPDGTEIKPDAPQALPVIDNSRLMNLSLGAEKLSLDSAKYSIPLDDKTNVVITVDGKKVNCSVKYQDTLKGNQKISLEFTGTAAANIDSDVKVGFLPPRVKKAYVKCNMNTDTNAVLSITDSSKAPLEISSEGDKKKFEQFYELLLGDYNESKSASKFAGKAVSRKLCEIALPWNFAITVRVNLSVEGKVSITYSTSSTFGFEYRDKKLQTINNSSSKRSAELSGKVEATLFGGLTWNAFGFCIVDFGASIGAGAKSKTTIYHNSIVKGEFDAVCALPMSIGTKPENSQDGVSLVGLDVKLSDDFSICHELRFYPIFRVEFCTGDSLIGDIIGGVSEEFLGENNPFLLLHFDDYKPVKQCARGFSDTYNIEIGDDLELNIQDPNKMVFAVGEESLGLKITTLPKGLTVADVSISAENPKILNAECLLDDSDVTGLKDPRKNVNRKKTVNLKYSDKLEYEQCYYKEAVNEDTDHFKLTGLSDGVTKLTVKAGTFSKTIEVVVGNGGVADASASRFVLSDTLVNLSGNTSHKLFITTLPEGYTEADFSFSSDNPEIAAVDSTGIISAQNVIGSTIIYVSSNDGKYTSACMVFVSEKMTGSAAVNTSEDGGQGTFGGGSGGGAW